MKTVIYTLKLLSSLIISPRTGQALYEGIDFEQPINLDDLEDHKGDKINVIYPFYQYGEYDKYDPKHTEYYLPGSSIKGALFLNKEIRNQCMVDDIEVKNECIVLRKLWKAQNLEGEKIAKFDCFFDNVGIEMIKGGTKLQGELYLGEDIIFADVLKAANEDTKAKMNQMLEYIESLMKFDENKVNGDFKNTLREVQENLIDSKIRNNVILLGGYKGLLHSMILKDGAELKSGLFIDKSTMLPHGLVKIDYNMQ